MGYDALDSKQHLLLAGFQILQIEEHYGSHNKMRVAVARYRLICLDLTHTFEVLQNSLLEKWDQSDVDPMYKIQRRTS